MNKMQEKLRALVKGQDLNKNGLDREFDDLNASLDELQRLRDFKNTIEAIVSDPYGDRETERGKGFQAAIRVVRTILQEVYKEEKAYDNKHKS